MTDILCPTCADDLCPFGYRNGFRVLVCCTCGYEVEQKPSLAPLECAECHRKMIDQSDYLCPRCRGLEWAAVEVKRDIRRELKRL